jgi:hypothetical protein
MSNLLSVAVSLANLLAMQIGGYDMAVAEKWGKARVVAYRAEGVHNGREAVVFGDFEGKADVLDRVTVEFKWDCKKRKVIGPVTVTDGKTEIKNIKSDGTNCPPPQLKGVYEHFQTASHTVTGDQILIKGTRSYPPASVSNYPGSCSMRSIPGGTEEALLGVGGAGPEGLGMPIVPGGPVVIAADRKSFSMKAAGNWVWTLTPTLVE